MTQAKRRGELREVSASTPTMTIGEVLAVLKPEFTDVTISKLRFLEGAGLVTPDRTAAGYRKFSQDDVERLRFVLRTQRDQYLPLRVIKQRLHELERSGGVGAVSRAVGSLPHGVQDDDGEDEPVDGESDQDDTEEGAPPRFGREELCKAAGAQETALAALESFGLITPQDSDEHGALYTADDLLILRVAAELSTFGLEPRHLRMYKTFAEREATLFGQVAAPLVRQHNPDAHAQAQETVERLTRLCGQLHHAILRNALATWQQDTSR